MSITSLFTAEIFMTMLTAESAQANLTTTSSMASWEILGLAVFPSGGMGVTIIAVLTALCAFLVVYHHAFYPLLLKILGRKNNSASELPNVAEDQLPSIAVVMPAYNEQAAITDKLYNLATLDYPSDKLSIHIILDGCTDATQAVIDNTLKHPLFTDLAIEVHAFSQNKGKIRCLNNLVPRLEEELVALTDVSALISQDALKLATRHFVESKENPKAKKVGVVTGFYRLLHPASTGENLYWQQQCNQQIAESNLGAIQGAHGAFYVIRQALFKALPDDTINDDFIIPMQVVASGYKAVMDCDINSLELEETSDNQEASRRTRIAAGNIQQLIRLKHLLSPRYKQVAFMFASGKTLRVFIPHCMLIALLGSAILAPGSALFAAAFILQALVYALGSASLFEASWAKKFSPIAYLMKGHYYNLIGSTCYLWDALRGKHGFSMQHGAGTKTDKTTKNNSLDEECLQLKRTLRAKRILDVTISSIALILLSPLFPILAIAIKLESHGPAIFSQVRIGRCTPTQTTYFTMYKFRSMVQDAEKSTGATLAQKNDARITRMGQFMRKTRLDELPQLINVIRGDMSIVGPRPERPDFYGKLEDAIPFFSERTFGVLPGITGLAQVHQGYDTCIEDVRRKVGFDHSYALSLHNLKTWFTMDIWIMFKTVTVMVMGRGQ